MYVAEVERETLHTMR